MVVKFPLNQIIPPGYCHWGNDDEFHLSGIYDMKKMERLEGKKVTLSIKVGKKRKMVPGRLRIQIEYHHSYQWGYSLDCYFRPNNFEKMKGLMPH